ncbi:MAG: hypothetical protein Q9185_004453 [Variospora sp. 1 TL-2023]
MDFSHLESKVFGVLQMSMQLGSRGPPLLRSQNSLSVLLTPALSSRSTILAPHTCRTYLAIANITTLNRQTSPSYASRHASSAAAAAQQPSDDDHAADSSSRPQPQLQPQPLLRTPLPRSAEEIKRRQSSILDRMTNPERRQEASQTEGDMNSRIDSLLEISKASAKDGHGRPTAQSETALDFMNRVRAQERTQAYRKDFQQQQEKDRGSRQGNISRSMRFPIGGMVPREFTVVETREATRATATIKSRPSLGRTVEVIPDRGMDLGRALKSLDVNCALNNVRKDANKQRYYERPGLKRKRLHSERWRRRFRIGFKAVVAKVKSMRRKGW